MKAPKRRAGLLRNRGERGPLDDRRQRPVDVEEDRGPSRIGGELRQQRIHGFRIRRCDSSSSACSQGCSVRCSVWAAGRASSPPPSLWAAGGGGPPWRPPLRRGGGSPPSPASPTR